MGNAKASVRWRRALKPKAQSIVKNSNVVLCGLIEIYMELFVCVLDWR